MHFGGTRKTGLLRKTERTCESAHVEIEGERESICSTDRKAGWRARSFIFFSSYLYSLDSLAFTPAPRILV